MTSRNSNGLIPRLPSTEWGLNVFLQDISKDISVSDLESMKFLCIGKGGIKKGVLEPIKSALELFTILREREVISSENLLVLQAMIWHIGRKDLYFKFTKFCDQSINVLHFVAPSLQPDDGCQYVKFHVHGNAIKDRRYVNQLRAVVAEILCCPPEYIFIRGIEATNSYVVTLMVPDFGIRRLQMATACQKHALFSIGIDFFDIENVIIRCRDVRGARSKEEAKVLWQHLKEKVKQLNIESISPVPIVRLHSIASDKDLLSLPSDEMIERRKSF